MATVIFGVDFKARREREAAERYANHIASCAMGVDESIGPIEQMADEIIKQINPFDKEPA